MTAAVQAEEVVPDVRQVGRDISIAVGGRFRCGIDQWAYVPFDVPPGVRRITVTTSHDQFSLFPSARNVLDLGIFGPAGHSIGNSAGFRGWSGGARDTFRLGATEATPGYLAGPIDPGRWTLCLGPVVLNPFGMRWQATIVLESGEPASPRTSSTRARRTTLRGEKDWYRGDLHLHTVHSDGQYEPPELITVARDAGLDFIVSTDHNTSSANRAWDDSATDSPMVIAGEEVTTRHGHWLAIGLPTTGWVDWRYGPRDGLFRYFAGRVRADGGVVVAAHPAVPLPGSTWEFGYADVDAIEVWNGVWNLDDEVSLRIWQSLLRRGLRIVAVGGSDSHGSHQRIGSPQTVIRVANPSQAAVLEALRRGNSYIAESGAVSVDLRAWCPDGGASPGRQPGETIAVPQCAPVTVRATVSGAPDCSVGLITDAGCVARGRTDASGYADLTWTQEMTHVRFVRAEVRRAPSLRRHSMVALTNPIWLSHIEMAARRE